MLRYTEPELEIIRFHAEDILSGSPGFDGSEDLGDGDPGDSTIGEPGDDWDSNKSWFNN